MVPLNNIAIEVGKSFNIYNNYIFRNCIGQKFAMGEIKTVISRIVTRYYNNKVSTKNNISI